MSKALELLQHYWKHSEFRYPQEQIIDHVLKNQDTFALLPTGGGKSICFQIPGLLLPGLTLVISPLIALIEDQVQNLHQRGIKAIALAGSTTTEEISNILDNCAYGGYKFLYLAPERLQQSWIVERLAKLPVSLIAIDEAHCVSQWGHDFRPAYLQIHKLKEVFPEKPFIALTASANLQAQNDIIEHLKLKDPAVFKKSFYRDNLYYGVYKVPDKEQTIYKILKKNPAPTIIYARNRRQCQVFSDKLNQMSFSSTYFHGGLSSNEKKKRLKMWLDEKTPIMVATNAFGMGIDKDNVKNVIHLQIPENIESYYQEAGRAGRNGQKAFTTLLFDHQDIELNQQLFQSSLFDKDYLWLVYRKLNNYLGIAYGEGFNQQYSFNFKDFCNSYSFAAKRTYNVLQFLERQSVLKFSQNFGSKSALAITGSSSMLLDMVSEDQKQENFLLYLLRQFPNITETSVDIDLKKVATYLEYPEDSLKDYLTQWHQHALVNYQANDNDLSVIFFEAREDQRTLYRTLPYLTQQNELKKKQFKSMVFYVENQDICKSKIIQHYFDETTLEDCKKCSTCLTKGANTSDFDALKLAQIILEHLKDNPKTQADLLEDLPYKPYQIQGVLDLLVQDDKITENPNNQFTLK